MNDRLPLLPTPEQYHAFADYLCDAHSWYKHLPLLGGRRFVVFVAPDAGIGRLFATVREAGPETAAGYHPSAPPEGPEFTDDHPRLHYGWKTTREYRGRFGCLDYMRRRGEEDPWVRDAGPPVRLPPELEERCSFVLYPYVSLAFAEVISQPVHADAVAQLRGSAAHAAREELLDLARLSGLCRLAWSTLAKAERFTVISSKLAKTPLPTAQSAELRKYLELNDSAREACSVLQERETAKIRRGLVELDDWLRHRA